MRSLILCEGFDDVLIIGYFLNKTDGWIFEHNGKFSELYDLPKMDGKREVVEVYKKSNSVLGIWAVGGKDSFDEAYKFVKSNNELHPEEGIEKLFIILDRDELEINETLVILREKLNQCGICVNTLVNHENAAYHYEIDEEMYTIDIIPVIIPFDKTGALETVLLDGIAETGEEEKYIVECAKKYVEHFVSSEQLSKYLRHARLILKAKLSATISITNPDRSTNIFDKLLTSWPWEETDAVKRHFNTISKFLQ